MRALGLIELTHASTVQTAISIFQMRNWKPRPLIATYVIWRKSSDKAPTCRLVMTVTLHVTISSQIPIRHYTHISQPVCHLSQMWLLSTQSKSLPSCRACECQTGLLRTTGTRRRKRQILHTRKRNYEKWNTFRNSWPVTWASLRKIERMSRKKCRLRWRVKCLVLSGCKR